jgi:hypothetical protein
MKYYYPPAWLTLFRTEEGKIEANKKAIAHQQLLVRGAVALAVTGLFTNRRVQIGISNNLLQSL